MSKTTTASMENDPIFSPENKARARYVKWGKPGDFFKGTLLSTEFKPNPNKGGALSPVYEFKAHFGSYHHFEKNEQGVVVIDENPTKCGDGEVWIVGSLTTIDKVLKNVKPGTIVGFKFQEFSQGKDKSKNAAKVVHVYIGGKDPEYMGEGEDDLPNFAV